MKSVDRCRREALFEQIYGLQSLSKIGDCVDVQIDSEAMAELVCHQFGIDPAVVR